MLSTTCFYVSFHRRERAVWLTIHNHSCNFFIKAPSKRVSTFFKALEKAAETVKAILEKR